MISWRVLFERECMGTCGPGFLVKYFSVSSWQCGFGNCKHGNFWAIDGGKEKWVFLQGKMCAFYKVHHKVLFLWIHWPCQGEAKSLARPARLEHLTIRHCLWVSAFFSGLDLNCDLNCFECTISWQYSCKWFLCTRSAGEEKQLPDSQDSCVRRACFIMLHHISTRLHHLIISHTWFLFDSVQSFVASWFQVLSSAAGRWKEGEKGTWSTWITWNMLFLKNLFFI